jgi:hypothetical protein
MRSLTLPLALRATREMRVPELCWKLIVRARLLVAVALAGLLLSPALASAQTQTKVYVCTPSAKLLELVVNEPAGTLASVSSHNVGSGALEDCVAGPDGLIYVANGNNISRVEPGGTNETTIASELP